jgi:hypothetical protein
LLNRSWDSDEPIDAKVATIWLDDVSMTNLLESLAQY